MLHGAKMAVSGLRWPAILAAMASVARQTALLRQACLLPASCHIRSEKGRRIGWLI